MAWKLITRGFKSKAIITRGLGWGAIVRWVRDLYRIFIFDNKRRIFLHEPVKIIEMVFDNRRKEMIFNNQIIIMTFDNRRKIMY